MPVYALMVVLTLAVPLTPRAVLTPVARPMATPYPTYTPAPTQTQRPAATAVPATPTRVPSPTPSPYPAGGYTPAGTQQFCMSLPVVGNYCPDPGALLAGIWDGLIGHLWAWVQSMLTGTAPAASAGASSAPLPAPSPHAAHAAALAPRLAAPTATPRPTALAGGTSASATQAGGLVAHVLDVVMYEPDPTDSGFSALNALFNDLAGLGQEVLFALLFLGALRTVARSAKEGVRVWLSFVLRVVLVLVYISSLQWAFHMLAVSLSAAVAHVNAGGLGGFTSLLVGLLIPHLGVGTPLDGAGYVFQIVLLVLLSGVFVAVAISLLLVRIGALFVQLLLYVISPVMLPLLLEDSTRGVALSWLKTYLALSLYPFFAALELQVVDRVVFGFAANTVFSDPVTRAALGIVGLAVLQTVLALTMGLVGGMGLGRFGVPKTFRGKGG